MEATTEPTKATLPVVYEQNEDTLRAAANAAKGLKIAGPEDKPGYDAVYTNRVGLKRLRVAIDKQRVSLNADAVDWQRRVNAEAKRLTAIIEPVELELEAEQKRIDAERERIRAEAEAAARAKLDGRVAAFLALGVQVAPSAVGDLSDAEFDEMLKTAQAEHAARVERERVEAEAVRAAEEAKRKADEEARRVERERLAAERAALAEERRRIEIERERALAEVKRQEAIQRAEYEEQRVAQAKLDAERAAFEAQREAAKVKPVPVPEPETPPLFPEISEAGPVEPLSCVTFGGAAIPGDVRARMDADRAEAEDEAEAVAAARAWDGPRDRKIIAQFPEGFMRSTASYAHGYLAGMRAERARKAEGS